MSAADDIAREVDREFIRGIRQENPERPIFPCPTCGKETKIQTTGTRICCMQNCRAVIDTRRTAEVTIELIDNDMTVAAAQFDRWIAVTPTDAVNAQPVMLNRMFPEDNHECSQVRVYHDGKIQPVRLLQPIIVGPNQEVGFPAGTIGMKFAPLNATPEPVSVQPSLQDFQQGLEPAEIERPEATDDLRWQSTNEFSWDE